MPTLLVHPGVMQSGNEVFSALIQMQQQRLSVGNDLLNATRPCKHLNTRASMLMGENVAQSAGKWCLEAAELLEKAVGLAQTKQSERSSMG